MAEKAPQVFTLEGVNALVPQLKALVKRQLTARTEIEARLKKLGSLTGVARPELSPPEADDTDDVRRIKEDLLRRVSTYEAGWREVEGTGAILKDPRIGLLDFYGRVEGKLVWLCWRYGEDECTHYHALHEGFSARKAIGRDAKLRLMN